MVITKCDLVDAARLDGVSKEVRSLLALALPGLWTRPSGADEDIQVRDTGSYINTRVCLLFPDETHV